MRISDWSSDVCSSDLELAGLARLQHGSDGSRATCRKTVAAASPEIVTGSRPFANPPRHAEPGQQSHHHRVERRAELVREHRLRQPAQGEGRGDKTAPARRASRTPAGAPQPPEARERTAGQGGARESKYRVAPSH